MTDSVCPVCGEEITMNDDELLIWVNTWLDSARFVDKETGLIKVVTAVTADSTKALGVVGYEMR